MTDDTSRLLRKLASERILLLDGGMGTMIQRYGLGEDDYRGTRLARHAQPLKGNNDLLCLTRPDVVRAIHAAYLDAGSDIIETNTFNAQAISQSDYALSDLTYELNVEAARIARSVADEFSDRTPDKRRFVAGAVGPMSKALSMSVKVDDPAHREVDFDQVLSAYLEQMKGLLDGGSDLLLIETIFDTLNAKAAIQAARRLMQERGREIPLMLSVTIVDKSGRTLSGQTIEAFWTSIAHCRPLSVGLNCALGAAEMRPHVEVLSRLAPALVSCYPNAGLPNAFGGFDEAPEDLALVLGDYAREGLCNILGGCCGTTDQHIRAIAKAVEHIAPRVPAVSDGLTRYSGLEALTLRSDSNFTMIGERANVTGSKKFARLIASGDYSTALQVASEQVQNGANVVDLNLDEAMLDSEAEMTRFTRLIATEPDIAKVPLMVDSSKWSVIEAGLKNVQGKAIVNSISMKEGESEFLERARRVREYGAAVVVMAFDEQGQAETAARKFSICQRAYDLLVNQVGFPPEDIIFDLNVFAVATGIEGHNRFGMEFIEALRLVKQHLPGARVSGGISNLSFSFRGNDRVREAFHTAFLYHAIQAGLDMGIVNAGQLGVYEELPKDLLERVEDVLFDRRPDATERMIEFAQSVKGGVQSKVLDLSWRERPVAERIRHALVAGIVDYIAEDAEAARVELGGPLAVIEGPMMDGMKVVGDLFSVGKMFLPQVVKSARVMKRGVATLEPYILAGRKSGERSSNGRVLLATVKGDVHDIGKNIVGVVLGCNNYDVIDLGVMVPTERIVAEAEAQGVDIIGLSGLITPSLDEMAGVARALKRKGLALPLLIGGATTSRLHTAIKIAPEYNAEVVHVLDASRAVGVVAALLDKDKRCQLDKDNRLEQEQLRVRQSRATEDRKLLSLADARSRSPKLSFTADTSPRPSFLGLRQLKNCDLAEISRYIDWTFFFTAWEIKGRYPEVLSHPERGAAARDVFEAGQRILAQLIAEGRVTANVAYGFWPAVSRGDDIVLFADATRSQQLASFPMLRQQQLRAGEAVCRCLADYVAPESSGVADYVGAFAVTAGLGAESVVAEFEAARDDYSAILVKAITDRLAEASAEWLHQRVREEWGYESGRPLSNDQLIAEQYRGIRPAFGYPACPDHRGKLELFRLLEAQGIGMDLTESLAMTPAASVSGLYLAHPDASYFGVGKLARDQAQEYAARSGSSLQETERWLSPNLGYEPESPKP